MDFHRRYQHLCPRAETTSRLAQLCSASVQAALSDLDLSLDPCHLDQLLRLLNSFVLVAFGPETSKFWHRQPLGDQTAGPHTQGLCHFCHAFSLHGSCEHLHVAFLHMKLISLQEPQFPKRQRIPCKIPRIFYYQPILAKLRHPLLLLEKALSL